MTKNILVVEDDKDSRELLKTYLMKWNYRVYEAYNAQNAFEILKKKRIHIALIDWILPGISGIEICNKLRENHKDSYLYIIIITGKKTKDDVVEALSNGADDYIMKPFNFEELKLRIEAGIRIVNFQENLKSCYEELYKQTIEDSLTGLLNRKTILEKLQIELERHKRLDSELSIIMCDIDYFKKINDTYGHLAGDYILKKVGEIFRNNLRRYDFAGRYGGEEFLVILPHTNIFTAKKVAERIKLEVEKKIFNYGSNKIKITISFGICSSKYVKSLEDIIFKADKALYYAKSKGRNRIEVYVE